MASLFATLRTCLLGLLISVATLQLLLYRS